MSRVTMRSLVLLALTAAFAACHHDPPPAVAPTPNADSIAAANARRDAMARADAARRDSAARADAARRAADEDAARRRAAADADAARRRAEAAAAADRVTLSAKIFFDYDKANLRADATSALDAKIPVLQRNTAVRIRIEGNTDERGSPEYNLALGQRRAAQAMQYLVGHGIDKARVEIVSYGKERSVCMEHNESCWQENRRDEFVITAGTVAAASPQRTP